MGGTLEKGGPSSTTVKYVTLEEGERIRAGGWGIEGRQRGGGGGGRQKGSTSLRKSTIEIKGLAAAEVGRYR